MRIFDAALVYHYLAMIAATATAAATTSSGTIFAFVGYPQTPNVGTAYDISWRDGTGPYSVQLVCSTCRTEPTEPWNSTVSEEFVTWKPDSDICTTCIFYWYIYDEGADGELTSTNFKVSPALPSTSSIATASSIPSTSFESASDTAIAAATLSSVIFMSSSTSTDTTPSASAEASIPSEQTENAGDRLGSGEIASICVSSVGIVLFMVVVALICLLLRRRRRRRLRQVHKQRQKQQEQAIQIDESDYQTQQGGARGWQVRSHVPTAAAAPTPPPPSPPPPPPPSAATGSKQVPADYTRNDTKLDEYGSRDSNDPSRLGVGMRVGMVAGPRRDRIPIIHELPGDVETSTAKSFELPTTT